MKKISIVIPAYNEEAFIGPLLEKILQVSTERLGYEKEIIVVNDGSKDRTGQIALSFGQVRCIEQSNSGKGKAVQRGVYEATGDAILVQDADMEYEPGDIPAMLEAWRGDPMICIYGSRTLGQIRRSGWVWPFPGKHPAQGIAPWGCGILLSLLTLTLYGRWISDTLTAYKLYPLKALRSIPVITKGFETDHEITAKLIRAGMKIYEVPIAYTPRRAEEGKKIRGIDALIAVWTLLRFRFGSRNA